MKEHKMATDTTERKATRSTQGSAPPPPEPEHLPCPRCDSTNTKFCYYNNYNFSQPRHFCKSCRRYWTHGGTLRDIPIGGATRKNAKRCRTTISSITTSGAATVFSSTHHDFRHLHASNHGGSMPFVSDGNNVGGSFTSLLNSSPASGILPLGGFGLGLGLGLDDVGFGLGRAVWPFTGVVEGRPTGVNGGGPSTGGNTWQMENGESGFAISTPGSVFK